MIDGQPFVNANKIVSVSLTDELGWVDLTDGTNLRFQQGNNYNWELCQGQEGDVDLKWPLGDCEKRILNFPEIELKQAILKTKKLGEHWIKISFQGENND